MKKDKILLVDDDEIVLSTWQEQLKLAGYDVKTALSGKQAIKMIEAEVVDIVFTDLLMPKMNGVEVCKRIKELCSDIEVVFVSGYPYETEKYLMDFLKAGGRDEYLRKPLLEAEMVEITEKILNEKI